MLIMICLFTRYLFLRALPTKEAMAIILVLYPIFCEFGFPLILQSDNCGEFANGLLTALLDYVNANHRFTTPYNPRANGGVERYVGISTTLVGKLLEGALNLLDLKLATAQLAINSRVTGRHNSSFFTLMLARPAPSFRRLDADLLRASTLLSLFRPLTFCPPKLFQTPLSGVEC